MLSRSTCPCFSPPFFLLNSYMLSAQLVGQLLPFLVSVLPCCLLSWSVLLNSSLFLQFYPDMLTAQLVCQLLPLPVPVLSLHFVCSAGLSTYPFLVSAVSALPWPFVFSVGLSTSTFSFFSSTLACCLLSWLVVFFLKLKPAKTLEIYWGEFDDALYIMYIYVYVYNRVNSIIRIHKKAR